MDWIKQASEKYNKEKELQAEAIIKHTKLKSSYPEKVSELWAVFKDLFTKIDTQFDGPTTIEEDEEERLAFGIGKALIKCKAEQEEIFGGYVGWVKFEIYNKGTSITKSLPFEHFLLGNYNGKPEWVYRDSGKNEVLVDEKVIENIFKTALL